MLANKKQNLHGYIVTLIFAMFLKIMPLPDYLSRLNPDWVLLILIYWSIAIPERIGVFNAWLVGLIIDVLTGRLLGQQALIYSLISFTCLKLHKRLRQYSLLQQSLFIFLSLLFSQIMIFWIESIDSITQFTLIFWMPVFIGTLFWPLIYIALRFIRIFGQIR
ncbi:MAG: rod shape-determining protein MreD [Methylococcales symbiont of Hymedesmia sp. n. MRB-2018]|nr:MAG: rod shape-determining protein MreD [Methylococcales symbiont of Hymedesmia sp. n. MRB-2018]KAF3983410.1 MAG: rod shape-determining protein MreD [Methylococcales symbiont of Hymedesmia sp. n. MRB-2018]